MSSFLVTFKEVNQRGSEMQSGSPKSSRPRSVAPGGAHTSQRSGQVGFYMTSSRSHYHPQKETTSSHSQQAHAFLHPLHSSLSSVSLHHHPCLLCTHQAMPISLLIMSVFCPGLLVLPPTFGVLLITLQSPVQKLPPQGHLRLSHLFSALPVFT